MFHGLAFTVHRTPYSSCLTQVLQGSVPDDRAGGGGAAVEGQARISNFAAASSSSTNWEEFCFAASGRPLFYPVARR